MRIWEQTGITTEPTPMQMESRQRLTTSIRSKLLLIIPSHLWFDLDQWAVVRYFRHPRSKGSQPKWQW